MVLSGFGVARRQPLSFILDQLANRMQEYLATSFTTRQDAVDGLATCGFACVFLGESLDFAAERLQILRLCVRRGLDHVTAVDPTSVSVVQDDEVVEPLKELVVSFPYPFRNLDFYLDLNFFSFGFTAGGNSSSSPSRPTYSYVCLFRLCAIEKLFSHSLSPPDLP